MPDYPLYFFKCVFDNGDIQYLIGINMYDIFQMHCDLVSKAISITRLNVVTSDHLDALNSLISNFN